MKLCACKCQSVEIHIKITVPQHHPGTFSKNIDRENIPDVFWEVLSWDPPNV